MFRFTIRDLLWLMVVVAMGLGWYSHFAHERKRLDAERAQIYAERDIMKAGLIEQRRLYIDALKATGGKVTKPIFPPKD